MADGTNIEWTDATWNPVTGCSIKSMGCAHCYAMRLSGTRLRNHPSRAGLTDESKTGPVFNGKVRFNEQWLAQPLGWKRKRRIFVCAHGDLFHENVPDEWIDKVFAVMTLAPQHQFQVLTKRAERMRQYCETVTLTRLMAASQVIPPIGPRAVALQWPLPNVWLGVSAERQQEADQRIPHLVEAPAALRFVSLEPLLGPINLFNFIGPWGPKGSLQAPPQLDWVIVGGESGNGARPMQADWARAIRDQCAQAGVAFFFKQWGHWLVGRRISRDDGGLDHIVFPDGDEFHVVSDGHDIVLCGADDAKQPTHLWREFWADGHGNLCKRLSKKAAGRLLDGVEHNGMPA